MVLPLFKCPFTGLNVQPPVEETPPEKMAQDEYQAVLCPACGRTHFINVSTCKLLGENRTRQADYPPDSFSKRS
jgi:predicted RNA-binding Zn-ribbon protein involved in translation (DUF1610 family)